MGLLGDTEEPNRPFLRAENGEQRLGLADRRPDVVLAVLDEQWRPDPVGVGDRRDLAEVRRVVPRRRSELVRRPEAAADVASQHQDGHVADRATGHRGGEPVVVADDPGRQIATVRAAGDAEASRVGEAFGDERVDTGEHIAHRPGSPVADVRLVECASIALRPTRVAEEDAHPRGRQQVELEDWRPAVEGVGAAVDLGDEGRRIGHVPGGRGLCRAFRGAGRGTLSHGLRRVLRASQKPTLDLPAIDRDPALDRLAQLDVGEGVAVQIRQPSRGACLAVAHPEIVELGG